MKKGIIGYTGFVGSNLIHQCQYDEFYNSKNIDEIVNQEFDLLVCSGAPAAKWIANQQPIKDRENIQLLISCLKKVKSKKVILISTVDVYKSPNQVDEDTPIIGEGLHYYGQHRWELEVFIRENFDALIVRLPGLFGRGLKKNIIYDLIHQNMLEKICPDSVFQFYNLVHLWQDIQTALEHNLSLLNLATEPTSVREVAQRCFDWEFTNPSVLTSVSYDMRTKYSDLFQGNKSGYIYDKDQVLNELKVFVCSFST
jgi:nucleoside-diphosphate-sugar epimerase